MANFIIESKNGRGSDSRPPIPTWILFLVSIAILTFVFFDGFVEMEWRWTNIEEYSHGYMIPFVALFLFYQKLPDLLALEWKASWLGPFFMLGALAVWFLGEMSSPFINMHYAFPFALAALGISMLGFKGFKLTWASYAYLVFMIPLPNFWYKGISQQLQSVSAEIGVAVIRLFGISAYVAGNIIDLGVYQLRVVEACSGLRYLFPLMSFGFLIAYIYSGPNWHKWVIFLSTIVITILMNSFRIGVIGISVEYWGIEMAEGFLHDFEGWFIFIACLGVLFLEILLLNNTSTSARKAHPLDLIDLSYPSLAEIKAVRSGLRLSRPTVIATTILLLVALPVSISISDRVEFIPDRKVFSYFPLLRGEWIGRNSVIESNILEELDYPDYIKADYRRTGDPMPVNLYVAYHESQRAGSSIHAPRSCIPDRGWLISDLTQRNLGPALGLGDLSVNRLVISKDTHSQLVYCWFAQRGRVITNEYLVKWYLFTDGMTMQRSDGALVRLVTPVPPDTDIAGVDARLQQFLRDFYPIMERYLPGKNAEIQSAVSEGDG